jgi:hypothetical protein
MAMLDEAMVNVPNVAPADLSIDAIREAIAAQAWGWWYVHQDDVIVSRKVLFWTVSIRVRDLHGLFVRLFGEQP